MPDPNDEYAQNHPYRALGLGYWLPWSMALLALFAAFGAMVFFLLGLPQPGRIIIHGTGLILFILGLLALKRHTDNTMARRGLANPMRTAMRRYQRGILASMLIYVVALLAAFYYWKTAHPTGLTALAVALVPSMPMLFVLRAMVLLLREETDECLRLKMLEVWAIATGVTLAVTTVVGFLDAFKVVPHIPLWMVLPFWSGCLGMAQAVTGKRCI